MKSLVYIIALLAITIPCYADTLTVNPDGSAQYTSISQALNASQPGDTIQLQPGIYRGSQNRSLNHSKGNLTIKSEQGAESCIIDCESMSRFLSISTEQNTTVTLRGLKIVNSNDYYGAIRLSSNGNLSLENCIIQDCSGSYSGAIYAEGNSNFLNQISLTRCHFLRNTAQYYGGTMYANDIKVEINHCIFTDNIAGYYGGVLYTQSYSQEENIAISNSIFHNNMASEGYGSILFGTIYASLAFTNCIFTNNQDYLVCVDTSNIFANNCLFYNNSGGLYYDMNTGNTLSNVSSLNSMSGSSGNISGQPKFASDNDFHLLDGSAAIDAGLTTPDTTDLDGLTRQVDGDMDGTALQDIGPYEYDPYHPLIAVADSKLTFIRDVNAPNPEPMEFSFRNTTSSPLNWTLTSDTPWLTVDQSAGELINDQTTVSVTVDSNGLARGVYTANLTLSDPNAVNSPVTVPVWLYVKGTLLVPDEFPTIVDAVANAMSDETIKVYGGTYSQSITLDKPLTLIGYEDPNIDTYNTAISISADNCTVKGFHINQGSSYGLYITGSNNTVKDMTIINASTGIYLNSGSGNTLDQIAVSDCSTRGLNIQYSPNNTLTNVTMTNCTQGFNLIGSVANDYQQSIDQTNTVDSKPIFYLVGATDMVLAPNIGAPACVYLVDCTAIVLYRLSISDMGRGVCMINSTGCTMRMTTISNCNEGLWLEDSSNNTFLSNTIKDCDYGIQLLSSAQTTMTKNTLTNNTSGFSISVDNMEQYVQMIDTTNVINDLPMYYLVNENNATIDANTPAACVYAIQCNNLSISDQTITNNTYGIALIECKNSSIMDTTCYDNVQSNLWIYNGDGISVERCQFTNSQYGVQLTESDDILITNCKLAYNGTGLWNEYSGFIMTSCLIHDNTNYGGIRHYPTSNRKVILDLCTLTHNSYGTNSSVNYGGAITSNSDYLIMQDCILWGNTPGSIPYPDSSDYKAISCCIQNEIDGEGIITVDPLLTSDGHLTADSPCINGSTSGRRRVSGVDIDGEQRRIGGGLDIGADEFLDTDSDKLPDWFEREVDPNGLAMNPNDDLDGDEYTNIEEYVRFSGSALIPSGVTYVDPVNGKDSNIGNDPNAPKRTLNNALASVNSGERIVLMPGIYTGNSFAIPAQNVLIQSIDPFDPNIVNSTIIMSAFNLYSQGNYTEFKGLCFKTISNSCSGITATFTNCIFTQTVNIPLETYNCTLTFKNCKFTQNHGLTGSIFAQSSNIRMENCLIADNTISGGYAQALTLIAEDQTHKSELINCTIANNTGTVMPDLASYYTIDTLPAILAYGINLNITNSIIWDVNTAIFDLLPDDLPSNIWITYSNISGLDDNFNTDWLGLGNISLKPGFAQLGYQTGTSGRSSSYVPGDYHLLNEAGRWDSTLNDWVQDTTTSACVGAANPGLQASDPNWTGLRHNLGAYGNTAEQSQAPANWTLVGDLTNNGIVDSQDQLAYNYHNSISITELAYLGTHPCDLNQDGTVNASDLQILQDQMGLTTDWYIEGFINDQWATPPSWFSTGSNSGGSSGGNTGTTR